MKTTIMSTFYCLIFNLLLSLGAHAAGLLVISDIDDTVKQTNSEGKAAKVYHFLKNRPYPHTRDLLNELVENRRELGQEVRFVYVSAAYEFMFNAPKFIAKSKLPAGKTILRKLNSGDTFTFKFTTIKKLIEEAGADTEILLLGDNSEHDHDVYWQIKRDVAPKATVFVRDVATWARPWNSELEVRAIDGINFFFSERDLLGHEFFRFTSQELGERIQADYVSKKIVPKYTTKTLFRRLSSKRQCLQQAALDLVLKCRRQAKTDAAQLIEGYYAL